MTFLSRILGFVRDVIFARFFGADAGTDAFFVAFKIPNFLRRLFAEGAFSQAFIPVFSDYKEQGGKALLKIFLDRTGGTLALILMAVTIVGVLASPVIIAVFAPGFYLDGEGGQYEMAVEMLRITFPYLFFISSTAFAGAILNTYGRFAIPAFTPVFLNICMISAAVWLAPQMDKPVIALAYGVLLAGMVQLAFQFPALKKLGLLPRLQWGFHDAGVRRIMKLMVPALFGVSVTQINLLFDTLIASFLVTGSVSWLYYSDRLVEFPLGIFGIALATVILPALSKSHAGQKSEAFSLALDWALRWVVLIGLPSALGLMLLAEPILSTLFQYNEFSSRDVVLAGQSLKAYSIGLLGFILIKVLVPGFTSRKDMATPVRFGIYAMVANMILNILLVFKLAHAGLALATSLSAFINAGLLLSTLLRHKVYQPEKGWGIFFLRVITACICMGSVLFYGLDTHAWFDWSVSERAWRLAAWISGAIGVYCLTLLISGLRFSHLTQKVNA